MIGSPRVSVLLPVRNAADTLEGAIRSVRAQTFADWELIAVDDGSTDRSVEILDRIEALVARATLVRLPPSGIVPALEAGRSAARGELIARMDADDVAEPDRFRRQVALLDAQPDLAMCGTHVRYFPRRGLRRGARRYERWLNSLRTPADIERNLWIECPLAHPTLMIRADVLEEIGGYRGGPWPEDYDLVLRAWAAGHRSGVVPRVLLHWRDAPERLSRSDARYDPDAFRTLKLEHLRRSLLHDRDGLLIWGTGPLGKSLAREARARGIAVRAFVDVTPKKIGQRILGTPVIAPSDLSSYRESLGVAAVGKGGARAQIRDAFDRAGWIEGRDYVAMA